MQELLYTVYHSVQFSCRVCLRALVHNLLKLNERALKLFPGMCSVQGRRKRGEQEKPYLFFSQVLFCAN